MGIYVWGLVLLVKTSLRARADGGAPPPGSSTCNPSCGDVEIPYPFGMGKGCYLQPDFEVNCNLTYEPPKPFLGDSIEVVAINASSSEIRILLDISFACFENSSGIPHDLKTWRIKFASTGRLSSLKNVFVAVGCDTSARFEIGESFAGCISGCNSKDSVVDGECSGFGCCETSIPKDVSSYITTAYDRDNGSLTYEFNPCNYFFITEKGNYTFHRDDIVHMDTGRRFPVVVDWAIRDMPTCQEAISGPGYACTGSYTECVGSINGPGYTCRCKLGYQGNPYLSEGCLDIDECSNLSFYPCKGKCLNKLGGYDCVCPLGFHSTDPYQEECVRDHGIIYAGIAGGVVLLLLIFSLIVWYFTRLHDKKLRDKYYEEHGGNYLEGMSPDNNRFKIYTMSQLKIATKNFGTKLGEGGFGTVFKGSIEDEGEIAVKRSKYMDDKKRRHLAKEIILLSQVDNEHIVKLLGCCLQDAVPILIYEYVPNGTLESLIHRGGPLSFGSRLRIITEITKGFKYLHGGIDDDTAILHGDVKPANILLDDKYSAKISDFGTSKIVADDKSWFDTVVQGTPTYLDPDYITSGHLTARSDVYSFGVVLIELLTRKKPFNIRATTKKEKSLVIKFRSCFKDNNLEGVLDNELIEEVKSKRLFEELSKISNIAFRCLNLNGEDRPSMKEIVDELETIHVPEISRPLPPLNQNNEERPLIVGLPSDSSNFTPTQSGSLVFNIENFGY